MRLKLFESSFVLIHKSCRHLLWHKMIYRRLHMERPLLQPTQRRAFLCERFIFFGRVWKKVHGEQEKKEGLKHRLIKHEHHEEHDSMVLLYGRQCAVVYGCRRILSYSPRLIELEVDGKPLSISGACLFCSSFSAGAITVRGVIEGIRYEGCE